MSRHDGVLAVLAAQLRATRADFIYLANLHPRDSAYRLGHPLDALAHARPLARGPTKAP